MVRVMIGPVELHSYSSNADMMRRHETELISVALNASSPMVDFKFIS